MYFLEGEMKIMQNIAILDKLYLTAQDLSDLLGVSIGHSYKIMRALNNELSEQGYIVIAGRIPTAFFCKKYYGFSQN